MRMKLALLAGGVAAYAALVAGAACVPGYQFAGGADAASDGTDDSRGAADAEDDRALPPDAAPTDAPPSASLPAVVVGPSEYSNDECALYQGSYRCWADPGSDDFGELGFGEVDGGVVVPPQPMPVSPNGTPSAFVLGGFHSCAIYGREVYCRGRGEERGNPAINDGGVETPVLGLPTGGVDLIAGGISHTCAITFAANGGAEGNLYCWGWNAHGACGRPLNAQDTTVSAYPVLLTSDAGTGSTISDARIVAGGGEHTCAWTDSGTLYCWGTSGYYESGPVEGPQCDQYYWQSCTPSPQAVPLPAGDPVVSLALGYDHSCAATGSGKVYCWGSNYYGQIGSTSVPQMCAVTGTDGGQLSPCAQQPTLVPGVSAIRTLSAGAYHTCGIDTGGHVFCWGRKDDGELGGGDNITGNGPLEVMDPTLQQPIVVDAISAGGLRTCAHASSGKVLCWGAGELATEVPDAQPPDPGYPQPVLF